MKPIDFYLGRTIGVVVLERAISTFGIECVNCVVAGDVLLHADMDVDERDCDGELSVG